MIEDDDDDGDNGIWVSVMWSGVNGLLEVEIGQLTIEEVHYHLWKTMVRIKEIVQCVLNIISLFCPTDDLGSKENAQNFIYKFPDIKYVKRSELDMVLAALRVRVWM